MKEIMGKDDHEFNAWKAEMEYKDNVEREEQIFKRKVEMKMSRELAIKAQDETKEYKQYIAKEFKEEAKKIKDDHELAKEEQIKENKLLVKVIEEQKENIKEEVKKMVEKKSY